MSRRHRAEKREVLPDPVHGDLVLTKFMNYVMYEGKKSVAEQIVYGALDSVEKKPSARRSKRSTMRWRTSRRRSKCARAASAARPIRCRSKFAPSAARRWPSAGWSALRARATRTPWRSASPASSSTPPTIAARRSRSVKTRTGWPKPTAPSPTIAGKPDRRLPAGSPKQPV